MRRGPSSGRGQHACVRRHPEHGVPQRVMRERLETFLADARQRGGGDGMPRRRARAITGYVNRQLIQAAAWLLAPPRREFKRRRRWRRSTGTRRWPPGSTCRARAPGLGVLRQCVIGRVGAR